MPLLEIIRQTRTVRRFDESRTITAKEIENLIELARLAGSARNLQPLKYCYSIEQELNKTIFSCLGWAGYLPHWPGPAPGERPTGYILCLLDTTIAAEADVDVGIASQNILLGATERGLAGCRIASINPSLVRELALPEALTLQLVIALGKPAEQVSLTDLDDLGSIKYWQGPNNSHFVPKRSLADIIIPLEA